VKKLGERQSFQYKQINIYIFDCRNDCIVTGWSFRENC